MSLTHYQIEEWTKIRNRKNPIVILTPMLMDTVIAIATRTVELLGE